MYRALTIAASLAAFAVPAAAQSGRVATLPSRPESPRSGPRDTGHPILHDGSIVVGSGQGYRTAVRSCAAWFGNADRPPQGGAASPPPGASGLPPAPGMSPAPGAQQDPRVAPSHSPSSRVGTTTPSSAGSSLRPLHSGWRTGGTIYFYDNVCYVRDRLGHVQLIQL